MWYSARMAIIRCEFRVLGAGCVVYRNDIICVCSKVCLWSLPRKTLQCDCGTNVDSSQQSVKPLR